GAASDARPSRRGSRRDSSRLRAPSHSVADRLDDARHLVLLHRALDPGYDQVILDPATIEEYADPRPGQHGWRVVGVDDPPSEELLERRREVREVRAVEGKRLPRG